MRMQRGFTILEMLIVTLIALIIFYIGFAMLNGISTVRAQSVVRLRATENQRLFFNVLEKDLEGAWPGPHNMAKGVGIYPDTSPYHMVVQETVAGVQYDILQFYTHNDTPGVTDEYVFVRYYVNHASNTICRQVFTGSDPATFNPEATSDPTLMTNDDRTSTADPVNDPIALQFALFDEVKSFYVVHRIWDPSLKALTPSIPDYQEMSNASPYTFDKATHIRVLLILRFSSDGGKTYQERTFSKLFELPSTFSGS